MTGVPTRWDVVVTAHSASRRFASASARAPCDNQATPRKHFAGAKTKTARRANAICGVWASPDQQIMECNRDIKHAAAEAAIRWPGPYRTDPSNAQGMLSRVDNRELDKECLESLVQIGALPIQRLDRQRHHLAGLDPTTGIEQRDIKDFRIGRLALRIIGNSHGSHEIIGALGGVEELRRGAELKEHACSFVLCGRFLDAAFQIRSASCWPTSWYPWPHPSTCAS